MKAIIIDDERLAREELKSLLEEHPEITIIGEARNGKEAIEKIKDYQPDVIFLDIEMPGMNGLDLLKELDIIPYIIFVSAYENHAVDAFKVNAVDYVLKPIDPSRLKESLFKLKVLEDEENYFQSNTNLYRKNRILKSRDNLLIKEEDIYHFPKISEIKYIKSEGNYVDIFFDDKCVSVHRTLSSIEERLDPDHFFRPNRSIIINTDYIDSITNWFSGSLLIKMNDGLEVQTSRRQGAKFRDEMSL